MASDGVFRRVFEWMMIPSLLGNAGRKELFMPKAGHRILYCPRCLRHATVTARDTRLTCFYCHVEFVAKPGKELTRNDGNALYETNV